MEALSIVTRLYLTKIVKDAIRKGITRYLYIDSGCNIHDKDKLVNFIVDSLGGESEEILRIVKEFFIKRG